MARVLIAGNGYAGFTAAGILLDRTDYEVVLVSAEHYPHYCPHLLPELGAGLITTDSLLLAEPEDYSRQRLTFLPGRRLEKIDEKENVAYLSDGSEIRFDMMLAATGSEVFVPDSIRKTVNLNCANVISMKHLADAEKLLGLISAGARHITIIGAGRIGVLAAGALVKKNLEVTVVDIAPHALAAMVIPEIGELVDARLREMGIKLMTSTVIKESEDDGYTVFSLKTEEGVSIPSHAVIVATGVRPSFGYLKDRVQYADGILVDNQMRTSDPFIFAAGDVVQFFTYTGRRRVVPLVLNAVRQARVAALNMAGEKVGSPPNFEGNIVRLNRHAVISIGEKQGTDIDVLDESDSRTAIIREGTEITGIQFFGAAEEAASLASLIGKKFSPAAIKTIKSQLKNFFPYLVGGGFR